MNVLYRKLFGSLRATLVIVTIGAGMGNHRANADVSAPILDPRDCVCDALTWAPRDVFTARDVMTESGLQIQVVEVIMHGVPERQVPGELISGFRYPQFFPEPDDTGMNVVFESGTRDWFWRIPVPTLDTAAIRFRTLVVDPHPGNKYERKCKTEFGVPQLKRFLDGLAAEDRLTATKDSCRKLATKHLGIPKPVQESDNMLECAGGGSPGWLLSVLTMLGLFGWRKRRQSTLH